MLRRNEIRAPRDGEVQNINPRIYTVGAVVRPGDTLLEIVPKNDNLIIEAQVAVTDIDRLSGISNVVEVRLPSFHQRKHQQSLGQRKPYRATV